MSSLLHSYRSNIRRYLLLLILLLLLLNLQATIVKFFLEGLRKRKDSCYLKKFAIQFRNNFLLSFFRVCLIILSEKVSNTNTFATCCTEFSVALEILFLFMSQAITLVVYCIQQREVIMRLSILNQVIKEESSVFCENVLL